MLCTMARPLLQQIASNAKCMLHTVYLRYSGYIHCHKQSVAISDGQLREHLLPSDIPTTYDGAHLQLDCGYVPRIYLCLARSSLIKVL